MVLKQAANGQFISAPQDNVIETRKQRERMSDLEEKPSTEENAPEVPLPTPTSQPTFKDKLILGTIGVIIGVLMGGFVIWMGAKADQRNLSGMFFLVSYVVLFVKIRSYKRGRKLPRQNPEKILDDFQWIACIVGLAIVDFGLLILHLILSA